MSHWTQDSIGNFVYNISLDFFTQLEDRIQDSKLQRKDLADKLGVTPSAVSQMLNSPPAKPELETLVRYALGVGSKVAVVLYSDGDPDGERGPVYSGIFEKSWEALNKPRDLQAVSEAQLQTFRTNLDWLCVARHASEGPKIKQSFQGGVLGDFSQRPQRLFLVDRICQGQDRDRPKRINETPVTNGGNFSQCSLLGNDSLLGNERKASA